MDDWLIFQYHLTRAQAESTVLREPPSGGYRPRWRRPAKGGRRRVGRPTRWSYVGQAGREAPQANPGGHQSRDVMSSRIRRSDGSHAAEKIL
jgi:hypothetical protein